MYHIKYLIISNNIITAADIQYISRLQSFIGSVLLTVFFCYFLDLFIRMNTSVCVFKHAPLQHISKTEQTKTLFPQYLVAIPAVIEAGAEAKFCATLRQPSGTLVMTVTLMSREKNTTLFTHTSNEAFQTCVQFEAPLVQKEVHHFQVEVRGDTFYSKQVRKVMIQASDPVTFIQTDKPIYLPGQKVNFRVVAMDNRMRPANQLDPHSNRIGQWLNETSNSRILQLSYSLDAEAPEGPYQIIVSVGERKISHNFKVEKYVLPKFDVTVNISEEVSIGKEDIEAKVYTYGQPVPGRVTVNVCRPINLYRGFGILVHSEDDLALLQISAPCHTETKQVQLWLHFSFFPDTLGTFRAKVEEEGTGKLCYSFKMTHRCRVTISYVLGKVSFINVPKVWERGSNVEGKDTVVALQALALYSTLVFSAEGWSTVTVQAPSSQLTFDVNQGNKLLYQEEALQDVSGKYRLEVKGTACASVQISATYNIPTPADVTTLSVKVHLEVNTSESARPKFTVYSGKEETTNMVILDIKMLSGFSPDPESLKSLKRGLLVSRVEQKEDHVLVYLEELSKDTPINHSLEIIQELPVDNLKPAVVKIYDYYQPGPSLTKLYSNSTLTHFRGSIRLNSSYKLMFPSVTQRNDTFMFFYHVSVR
uniref:Alpha-2-macroglobulin n=1 Tax=Maylandia zebra TaxID=106582 RepID=A0A3P9C0J6_9CICH